MQTLPTDYQTFIAISRYARWRDDLGRREYWDETVDRYVDNVIRPYIQNDENVVQEIRSAILNLEVMPSMRGLMTAGTALNRDHTCLYNCSYLPVDDPKAFDEALHILCCGTGVGFSVERQYVNKLPEVPENLYDSETTVVVKDSKEGWAKALRQVIALLYSGEIPKWDVSKVRPAGSRLKTFGGRSSGPGPLIDLFKFVVNVFKHAAGRKLNSLECHDIMCKIGEIVVVGGVRRAAMCSLSNLSDDRMRNAKNGQWWELNPQRALSNNSVAYTETPDMETFLREWLTLVESKSGERGIFNRVAAQKQAERTGRREKEVAYGSNPCFEILLRPYGFCNLTEVIARENDTEETLANKVRIATIIGTIQSAYTKFPYLRKIWQKNAEEERLLGVSITGIMDCPKLNFSSYQEDSEKLKSLLNSLKETAIESNKVWANILGINQSTAITCVKPSGNVSQLVNSSSGIHTRYSPYYVRTVRADIKDPLTQFMGDQGVPSEPCVFKGDSTVVFSFPTRSPDCSLFRESMTAIEQLEFWLIYQRYWCEHKPSITVYVKDHEWMEVGAFVYKNFDEISGISFLPHTDHVYQQAPYQEITKEQYKEAVAKMPKKIDWSKLSEYEKEDNTKGSQTLNCTGGVCEIVDLT